MIEAVVLATGLLLVLAGIASAWIPGGASFARPGISHSPLRAFLISPIHPQTWYANGAIVLGLFVGVFAFSAILALISTGLTVLLAGIGVVLIAMGIEGSRIVAVIERWRVFVGEPVRPAAHPYRPLRGSVVDILRAEFADEARWRDVLYVAIDFPLTLIEFLVVGLAWGGALVLLTMPVWLDAPQLYGIPAWFGTLAGLVLLFGAASLSQLIIRLHRQVVVGLLCTSESRELRRQVETLRRSRSDVLDVEAIELSRIERDLHDGAQQRLVALSIDLGRATERIDTDPQGAKELVRASQEQARQALADIRQLVRGIAPSILLDRGLVPAIESITGRGPVPTTVLSGLAPGERLPPAVERAAYFVVSEALANVAKHSGATTCEVRCRREGPDLVVEVWDDGRGGATIASGGLAGLQTRVTGVDGRLSVSSPPGGPTLVRAVIPAAVVAAPPESSR